jgi:small-conductance mechanosensitive channel
MGEQLKSWLFDPTVDKFAAAVIAVIVVYALSRLAQRSVNRLVADSTSRYRGRKFVAFVGYFIAIAVVASIFSSRLGGLTVAFGVAGAGIAFALQEVIASTAGWVVVSVGNYYSIGDRVQLGGIKGDVIDVGILRTTLMEVGAWVNADLYNGRIVRIANSFVFKEPVFNYSADFPFLWDEITLPVRYGSDWEYARGVLSRVVDEICKDYALESAGAWRHAVNRYRLEEAKIEPMVTLAATDNWIQFTIRYIVDYRRRRVVRDRLFTRILEEVDKSRNRIRLASATFEVTNIPRLNLQFSAGKGSVDPEYLP